MDEINQNRFRIKEVNKQEFWFIILISFCTFFIGYLYASSDLLFYFSYTFNISPYSPEIDTLNQVSNYSSILGSLISIVLIKKCPSKLTLQIALTILIIVTFLIPFASNFTVFSALICISTFVVSILYTTSIVIAISHVRKRTGNMRYRLIVALLITVLFYILGLLSCDLIRITLENLNPNSFMVGAGWKIIIALPVLFAAIILALITFTKWKSDALLSRIYGNSRSFVGLTNNRKIIVSCMIIILFTYLQGSDTIENLVPKMLYQDSWTKLSLNIFDITTDLLAVFSVVIAYFLLQKFKIETLIIFNAAVVLFCMISGNIYTYVFNGMNSDGIVFYTLAVIFITLITISSNLSTWILPLIMIIKHTKSERLFLVIPITAAFDRMSLGFAYLTGFDLSLIPSTIFSVVILLIAVFILNNKEDNKVVNNE